MVKVSEVVKFKLFIDGNKDMLKGFNIGIGIGLLWFELVFWFDLAVIFSWDSKVLWMMGWFCFILVLFLFVLVGFYFIDLFFCFLLFLVFIFFKICVLLLKFIRKLI